MLDGGRAFRPMEPRIVGPQQPQAAPSLAAGASRGVRVEGGRGRGLQRAAGVRGSQGAEPSASRGRGGGRTRTQEAVRFPRFSAEVRPGSAARSPGPPRA